MSTGIEFSGDKIRTYQRRKLTYKKYPLEKHQKMTKDKVIKVIKHIIQQIIYSKLIHRCTWVENPGEEVPEVFDKIPRGVKAFRITCQRGGSTLPGFISFLLASVLKLV
jgi:hypothetical protein